MKASHRLILSLACALPTLGQAQSQDDLQPGVNTSAMPAQSPAASAPAPQSARAKAMREKVEAALAASDGTAAGAPSPAPAAPVAAPSAAAAALSPSAAARPTKADTASPATRTAKGGSAGKASDRIDLDTTQITGNKELPKVMYVVPWKHADLGDLTGKPANSLVDEVLQPVDRDVFNREERYYHTVAPEKSPAAPQTGSPATH